MSIAVTASNPKSVKGSMVLHQANSLNGLYCIHLIEWTFEEATELSGIPLLYCKLEF